MVSSLWLVCKCEEFKRSPAFKGEVSASYLITIFSSRMITTWRPTISNSRSLLLFL